MSIGMMEYTHFTELVQARRGIDLKTTDFSFLVKTKIIQIDLMIATYVILDDIALHLLTQK